jgi:AAA family ATP:ADP antiporter
MSMNQGRSKVDLAVLSATLAATAMIAFQVASKATRDALFLSNFEITDLPVMVIAAAVLSMIMVFPATGAMARIGPGRLIPAAFLVSGALNLAEWFLVGPAPRVASVIIYLHLAAFGAILISGFWSLVNESLDPRTAKKSMGRIGTGATLGGLLGGLLAQQVGQHFSVAVMLPTLAALHLLCALGVRYLAALQDSPSTRAAGDSEEIALTPLQGLETIRSMPYLRNLAVLVLLAAVGAGLLDYVLKARAADTLTGGEELLSFFGIFYTGVSLLTFIVQTTLSRRILESAGLARAVGSLPATVAVGSFGSLFAPGLISASLARGGEAVIHNSLFRSGYELLMNPVAPGRKRSTKTIIDVGVDRLGDALGGGFIKGVITVIPGLAQNLLLMTALALSMVSLFIASRLHRGYIKVLEKSLASRAVDVGDIEVGDRITRDTILQTMGSLGLADPLRGGAKPGITRSSKPREEIRAADPVVRQILDLRSGEPRRIIPILSSEEGLSLATVPHLLSLLAWDEISDRVIHALRKIAPRVTGQLCDALLDPDAEFAVRRRIPRILVICDSRPAVEGMMSALADRRFEVRCQCGRALARVLERHPDLSVPEADVFAAAEREVTVDRRVWESRKLLDSMPDPELSSFEDEYLKKRATRSLEHVFTILSLTLPREALMIAYRGLHTEDRFLRGTALEYLELVLPDTLRRKLWPFLEEDSSRKNPEQKTSDEILRALMESNQSIEINLRELRAQEKPDDSEGA